MKSIFEKTIFEECLLNNLKRNVLNESFKRIKSKQQSQFKEITELTRRIKKTKWKEKLYIKHLYLSKLNLKSIS